LDDEFSCEEAPEIGDNNISQAGAPIHDNVNTSAHKNVFIFIFNIILPIEKTAVENLDGSLLHSATPSHYMDS